MTVSALQPDSNKTWDPGEDSSNIPITNNHVYAVLSITMSMANANVSLANGVEQGDVDKDLRTELDSHSNMPVVGRNCYILSRPGKSVDVSPFTPDYEPITVELVDAAIYYESPFDGREYVFVLHNALHCPSMKHNLLPPFMLREAGFAVSEVPKIQVDDPTVDDHAIRHPETGLRIPLSLWGIFSYFPTRKPKVSELQKSEEVEGIYILTPEVWNPHSDAYAFNEESMLDWEGEMRLPKDREHRVVLADVPEDEMMVSSLAISEEEMQLVDD